MNDLLEELLIALYKYRTWIFNGHTYRVCEIPEGGHYLRTTVTPDELRADVRAGMLKFLAEKMIGHANETPELLGSTLPDLEALRDALK